MTIVAPAPQVSQSLPRVTAFRNVRWCAAWAFAVVIATVCVLYPNRYLQFPALLFFLYALQALIAECLGVRISVDWVSAPRRLPGMWPIALFWRAYGSPSEIEGITSLAAAGPGVVELNWMRGGRIVLLMADRESKLAFFEALRRYRPQVRIFREIRREHSYGPIERA
jgi:hypothetical protein